MGRKPKSSLKVKGFSIYPILLRSNKPERAISFKVVEGNVKKGIQFDFETYFENKVRIVTKEEFYDDGKLNGGPDFQKTNRRLQFIQNKIADFIESNEFIDKKLLANFVYGPGFFEQASKKGTKSVTIPVRIGGVVKDKLETTKTKIKELLDAESTTTIRYQDAKGNTKKIKTILDDEGGSLIENEENAEQFIVDLHSAVLAP